MNACFQTILFVFICPYDISLQQWHIGLITIFNQVLICSRASPQLLFVFFLTFVLTVLGFSHFNINCNINLLSFMENLIIFITISLNLQIDIGNITCFMILGILHLQSLATYLAFLNISHFSQIGLEHLCCIFLCTSC